MPKHKHDKQNIEVKSMKRGKQLGFPLDTKMATM